MSHKKKFNLDNKLDKIENKISRLNKSFNDTFWLTRISEGSYTHSYWQDYFDFEFLELNKKKTNNNFFKFFQYILVFFSNFTKDLILSLLIYQNTKFKKKNIIYLNSKHIRKTKHTNYSFLTEDKIDNHTDNIYLISISRSSSNSLLPLNIIFKNYLRFKKNNNIIILESFLKPLSVLKNYLFIYNKIKISFEISKKLKLDFSKFVSFIIDISKQSSVLSILSNKKCSAVFSSANFVIRFFVIL